MMRYRLGGFVVVALLIVASMQNHAHATNALYQNDSIGMGGTLSQGSCSLSFIYSTYYFSGSYIMSQDCENWSSIYDDDYWHYARGTHTNQWIAVDSGGYLTMQSDGNLVLYNSNNEAGWTTYTSGAGNYFWVQSDGNMVVYNANNAPLWSLFG
jgi:hypothetical protein